MHPGVFWLIVLAVATVALEAVRRIRRYRKRIKEHPQALATAVEAVRELQTILGGEAALHEGRLTQLVSRLGYCRQRLRPPARGQIRRIRDLVAGYLALAPEKRAPALPSPLTGLVETFLETSLRLKTTAD